jgi:hypothetical protein
MRNCGHPDEMRRSRPTRRRSPHDPLAHVWHHDAFATCCAKQLLKPSGYLLMDDYDWTIAISPTMSPSVNPAVRRHYTEAQIETSHVEMICSILLDSDPNSRRFHWLHDPRHRRAYRRLI